MEKKLNSQCMLSVTQGYVHLAFSEVHRVISSAVLNGGSSDADHILNLRVPKQSNTTEKPEDTLLTFCQERAWSGSTVGLMTAASMDSFRWVHEQVQGIDIAVMVTAGLANARCTGDRAEYRNVLSPVLEVGTINVMLVTSACLSSAAMVEAIQMITEAKTACLHQAGVTSPVSGKLATGTGTDAVAVACRKGEVNVQFCGKHVLFGEVVGRLVTQAVNESIAWELARP